jgi:hypothetical protein
MNSMPARFAATMDTPGCAPAGSRRAGPRMLDEGDGPARLVFESSSGLRYVAQLDRWLVILRVQRPPRGASRVIWLLDARTVRWAAARPPAELRGGRTGLRTEEAPILWFRAGEGPDDWRRSTVPGVFGAAGIVDAAQVNVRASRIRRQVRLEISIDSALWGLCAAPEPPDGAPRSGRLTITATGALRPLEPQAITSWQ